MGVLSKILLAGDGRKLERLRAVVPLVAGWESELEALDDASLRERTNGLRQRLSAGEELDDVLPEAFALVREASRRVTGQRPFDVQVMGGAAMHAGWVAEMKTGEGKTLAATMPAYLNALVGQGVHIVTVNEYLAERDAASMGRIFGFLGLTTGVIVPGRWSSMTEKRAQYARDITYGINTEMGFDYLRDNMVMDLGDRVHRGFNFAIVDEVDSVLIDESRTPLIISAEPNPVSSPYGIYAAIVRSLTEGEHFEVRDDLHSAMLTDAGIDVVQERLGIDNLFSEDAQHVAHGIFAALKAHSLYVRDRHYVVLNGEVKIVDEFTGRVLDGRKWSDGIHQAVEAKEGVEISGESMTLATVTLQNYFRMYKKLAGMTGTAKNAASELMSTYKLDVVVIPTNREMIRVDHPTRILHTEESKFAAVVSEVAERHRRGQPVLVGTTNVATSERVSRMLAEVGIEHSVLNAKHHASEASIVAQAGRRGSVTVATNMAGRGVDILLGGNPAALASAQLLAEGFTDELFVHEGSLSHAQSQSSRETRVIRAEAEARRSVLVEEFRDQCARDGDEVRALGGLCVIGTELHESQRIDMQLRGRAGRQGDPGESVFFVSLEDDMMALYAADALEWADQKKWPEGEFISVRWVEKAALEAQATVEQKNASLRKNVLDYDEVLNQQRQVVYNRREQIVAGFDLKALALENLSDAIYALARRYLQEDGEWNVADFLSSLRALWPTSLTAADLSRMTSVDDIEAAALGDAAIFYEIIESNVGNSLMRDIERQMMLQILDKHWRGHLVAMESLQDGISLRASGQKNPLSEWQREGYAMFQVMLRAASLDFVRYVMHVRLLSEDSPLLAKADDEQ